MTNPVTTSRRAESVLVVVFADNGHVLLLKRASPFVFWQSVTGSLRNGETHADAAARELLEETGLSQQGVLSYTGVSRQFSIDARWRHRFAPGVLENVEFEYRYRIPAPTTVTLSANEHSDMQWLPLEAAIDRVWSWTNRAALESLRTDL